MANALAWNYPTWTTAICQRRKPTIVNLNHNFRTQDASSQLTVHWNPRTTVQILCRQATKMSMCIYFNHFISRKVSPCHAIIATNTTHGNTIRPYYALHGSFPSQVHTVHSKSKGTPVFILILFDLDQIFVTRFHVADMTIPASPVILSCSRSSAITSHHLPSHRMILTILPSARTIIRVHYS